MFKLKFQFLAKNGAVTISSQYQEHVSVSNHVMKNFYPPIKWKKRKNTKTRKKMEAVLVDKPGSVKMPHEHNYEVLIPHSSADIEI